MTATARIQPPPPEDLEQVRRETPAGVALVLLFGLLLWRGIRIGDLSVMSVLTATHGFRLVEAVNHPHVKVDYDKALVKKGPSIGTDDVLPVNPLDN